MQKEREKVEKALDKKGMKCSCTGVVFSYWSCLVCGTGKLKVSQGPLDTKVLLYCTNKCNYYEIIDILGLKSSELSTNKRTLEERILGSREKKPIKLENDERDALTLKYNLLYENCKKMHHEIVDLKEENHKLFVENVEYKKIINIDK